MHALRSRFLSVLESQQVGEDGAPGVFLADARKASGGGSLGRAMRIPLVRCTNLSMKFAYQSFEVS